MATPYEAFTTEVLTNDSSLTPSTYGKQFENKGPVKNVELCALENAKEHHTDVYHLVHSQLKTPIFRRGQPFTLQVHFKQPFKIAENNLRLDLYTGPAPAPGTNTLVHLTITESSEIPAGKDWGVRLKSKTDNSLTLEVRPSAAAPVGLWRLTIVTQPGKQEFHGPQHFYLIFNAWCKDDAVYMENDEWRKEYLLNEHGIIYQSNPDPHRSEEASGRGWGYNQFSAAVLPAAICMLEKGKLRPNGRNHPTEVTRMLTRVEGNTVLAGKWSGDFSDGAHPTLWQTSNKILAQYMATKRMVKYGQCWVFGAVLNALCRSLGIPCRVVTCFNSAHDVRQNLTLDLYIQDGKVEQGGDTIWNYHVWNDAWMSRPDMPSGYGGWQAIDATPQQQTLQQPQYFECGPASLEAIKKGEIGYVYDTQFLQTEVNADYVEWVKRDGKYEISHVYKNYCGKNILTKAVGQDHVHDVTDLYKYREGTEEERQSVYHAAKVIGIEQSLHSDFVNKMELENVFFDLLPVKNVMMGNALTLTIQVHNRTTKPPTTLTVSVKVGAQSVSYIGVKVADLDLSGEAKSEDKLHKKSIQLASGQKEIIVVEIPPSVYIDQLSDQGHVRIYAMGLVKEVHQDWFKQDTIMLVKPKIIVEIPTAIQVGKELSVTLKFKNPLPKELTGCVFTIESNCTDNDIESKFRNVKPNEEVTHEVKITPTHPGPLAVLAQFNSKELVDVTGSKTGNAV